jgi:hypothetical protein
MNMHASKKLETTHWRRPGMWTSNETAHVALKPSAYTVEMACSTMVDVV